VISTDEYALIRAVEGYRLKEGKRVDEKRAEAGVETRQGAKKATAVHISHDQARALKSQPDTPQGRRDAVLMCLLLDHGLRCGEVALLKVRHVDLKAGQLKFYRPKVDKEQTHNLSRDTLAALKAWFDSGDAPILKDAPLLRGSRKGGHLLNGGMSERAITARVADLGKVLKLENLSAHDCRHYWATKHAERGVDPFRLQEAGGWNSLTMPRRYVEAARIANEGMGD
jgi:integrase